jgi:hypothetical protein
LFKSFGAKAALATKERLMVIIFEVCVELHFPDDQVLEPSTTPKPMSASSMQLCRSGSAERCMGRPFNA